MHPITTKSQDGYQRLHVLLVLEGLKMNCA